MIRAVRINVPLVNVLAGMLNYGKFLKKLVSNKHKLEQILSDFLSDEISPMIQNKVPPKLGDPKSFLIPCNFTKAFSCNALADLLYAKLSLKTLKPTQMSVRLADRSFQRLIRIAENMLVEVGKFTFLVDFVILEIEEDVGTERMTFSIDSAMKHSYSNDDTCFSIDVIDEILEEDFDALLDDGSNILHSIEGTIIEEKLFTEFDEFMAMTVDEKSESDFDPEEPPLKKITFNIDYKIKTSLEEPPSDLELKPLPDNLEYVFLEEPSFLHVIISSQLSKQNRIGAVLGQKDGKHFHPIYFASKTLNAAQQKYTKTEKELMAIVFAFDKFQPYMILSKTFVYTDRLALRHLFKKQDAKPRLIRWILLLQEFDIEIKDKKGTENVVADHLSLIDNDETSDDSDTLQTVLVGDIIPKGMTYQQKKKLFPDLKNYFWEDPHLFKVCSNGMIRRCVSGPETRTILDQCHYGPTDGHYGQNIIAKKS
nr:reverse transcriptase domain-containing protein [Tanacetum cinerariifolium]